MRIPREIEIDNEGTELKVDALRSSLRRYKNRRSFTKLFNDGSLDVNWSRTGDDLLPFVSPTPIVVDYFRRWVGIRAVHHHKLVFVTVGGKQIEEILLCAA